MVEFIETNRVEINPNENDHLVAMVTYQDEVRV